MWIWYNTTKVGKLPIKAKEDNQPMKDEKYQMCEEDKVANAVILTIIVIIAIVIAIIAA